MVKGADMLGQVLEYNPASGEGVISAQDGKRYTFKGMEFKGDVLNCRAGLEVDFVAGATGATAVYPMPGQSGLDDGKSKVAAGILAILLGCLGIHKFYLGYTGSGVVMLLCGTIGWLLVVPGLVIWVISIVEGITYLTKTDAEFKRIYVENQKTWF